MGLLLVLTLWLLSPRIASAHAHLVQADPAPNSVIAQAPAVATFVFDEPLNPALTRVRVTDAAGRPVTTDAGHLASGHDGELWEVPLPRLTAGTYSVFWTSESATDGHVMGSFYTFRIAPSGGANSVGAVTGAAAGVYGGASGGSGLLNIGAGAAATALSTWLGLMAQALWLGALVVELAVLSPARRAPATAPARLAWAAAPALWALVRGSICVTLLALILDQLSLAVQGTGGDWVRALAPATVGGILSSQNGHLVVLRFLVLLLALPLAWAGHAPTAAPATDPSPRLRRGARALGIVAPSIVPGRPSWPSLRWPLAVLAVGYLLLVAASGHAADVTPRWLSYPIDWLHLLCTAAWAGGIAALAYGVLPPRLTLRPEERGPAVLPLLDRFSPVAYAAVAVLALSGLYNALNHLDAPAQLADTAYGQLLVLKLALVGLMILLSASHVFLLRPRLATLSRTLVREVRAAAHGEGQDRGGYAATLTAALETAASVHEGLATLAARLRLEVAVGAAILLATALMSQTLPTRGASIPPPAAATPIAISGEASMGDLRAQLTVAPPAGGATTFTLRIWEKGVPVTADTGAALIHLYPAAQPNLRAPLNPVAHGTQFTAQGSLAAIGTWRADVLVRTATVNDYRTLAFAFTVGPGASFLAPGLKPGAVTISVSPGRIAAPNTFTVAGLGAPAVRLLSQSLDMNMGILTYQATSLGHGRWRVDNVFAPMQGHWGLTVQAQHGGGWTSVRQFVYNLPLSGPMHLLTP
jgi:copper transport protein